MAQLQKILTAVAIAVAAIQVAFATYTYYPPCDPPRSPQNGGYRPEEKSYAFGSKIKYHCSYGYELHGTSWTVCKFNKKSYWTYPAPVCKPIKCPKLDIKYGDVTLTDGNRLGSHAHYNCKKGYKLYGDESRKCLYNGKWSGQEPMCKPITCPDLDNIKNGGVNMDDNSPGSTASYYCNEHHKLVGNKKRKCLYNGKWSGQEPMCKPITCPDLDNIKNGGVNMDDNSPGSTASYYCNEHHKLVGNKKRKCLKNGKWSGQEPMCKPISTCPDLDDIQYGGVNMDDNSPGSTASYYCNEHHKLVGNKKRKCLKNGKWSGQEPVCKKTPVEMLCPHPPAPQNGQVTVTEYTLFSRIYYSCDDGYRLFGQTWRKCLPNGKWNGRAPTCRPVKE